MLFTEAHSSFMIVVSSWHFGLENPPAVSFRRTGTFIAGHNVLSLAEGCSLARGLQGSGWLAWQIGAAVFVCNVSAPQTIRGSSIFAFCTSVYVME